MKISLDSRYSNKHQVRLEVSLMAIDEALPREEGDITEILNINWSDIVNRQLSRD